LTKNTETSDEVTLCFEHFYGNLRIVACYGNLHLRFYCYGNLCLRANFYGNLRLRPTIFRSLQDKKCIPSFSTIKAIKILKPNLFRLKEFAYLIINFTLVGIQG